VSELDLYKMAVGNAVAIFEGILNGEYCDQESELLYDAGLYIKGVELYNLKEEDDTTTV